jgi:Uma2 family endonuclease
MSQPIASALAPLPFELVYDDGEPLESDWHFMQHAFLRELLHQAMVEQGRTDTYAGGNMFIYYSVEQAREVATKGAPFRGPDVFWVTGVDEPGRLRKAWLSWEEGGRLPDLIVELLSPSTAQVDRTVKKELYARVFQTSEYYMYEPETRKLEGFWLAGGAYQPMAPGDQGRLWSKQLGLFLGLWHGFREDKEADWVRLYRPDGTLVPTQKELAQAERQRAEAERQRAEAAQQRADAERQRAEAAEAELARLRALLEGRGQA